MKTQFQRFTAGCLRLFLLILVQALPLSAHAVTSCGPVGGCINGNNVQCAPITSCCTTSTVSSSEALVPCGVGECPSVTFTCANPFPPAPSSAYPYKGCYVDNSSNRALPVQLNTSSGSTSGFTIDSCVAAAKAAGYTYAGLQNAGECWVGDTLQYTQASESDCSMACTSNDTQLCGGTLRNSIYATGAPAHISNSYPYVGCFQDTPTLRNMSHLLMSSGATIDSCVAKAKAAGYVYAGVQWFGECYGDNSLAVGLASENDCILPCTAKPIQLCGGTWRNSVYETGNSPPSGLPVTCDSTRCTLQVSGSGFAGSSHIQLSTPDGSLDAFTNSTNLTPARVLNYSSNSLTVLMPDWVLQSYGSVGVSVTGPGAISTPMPAYFGALSSQATDAAESAQTNGNSGAQVDQVNVWPSSLQTSLSFPSYSTCNPLPEGTKCNYPIDLHGTCCVPPLTLGANGLCAGCPSPTSFDPKTSGCSCPNGGKPTGLGAGACDNASGGIVPPCPKGQFLDVQDIKCKNLCPANTSVSADGNLCIANSPNTGGGYVPCPYGEICSGGGGGGGGGGGFFPPCTSEDCQAPPIPPPPNICLGPTC